MKGSEASQGEFACKYVDMIGQRTGLLARLDLQMRKPCATHWSVSAEQPMRDKGGILLTVDDWIQWVTNQAHHLEPAHLRVRAMASQRNIPYDVLSGDGLTPWAFACCKADSEGVVSRGQQGGTKRVKAYFVLNPQTLEWKKTDESVKRPCPVCHAKIGEPCKNFKQYVSKTHKPRGTCKSP